MTATPPENTVPGGYPVGTIINGNQWNGQAWTPVRAGKARSKTLWIVLGGGVAVLLLCFGGCAAMLAANSGESKDAGNTSVLGTPTTASPEEKPSPEGGDGPATAKVGQTITVSDGASGEDEIAYTVRSVKKVSSPNQFTQPGKGKMYIGVDLSIKMNKGDALMTGSEIKLVGSDGEVYNNKGLVVHDNAFEWTNLKAGQRKSGLVFFEVPTNMSLKGAKVEVNSYWSKAPSAYFVL